VSIDVRPAAAAEVPDAYELAARVFGPNYFEARAHNARLLSLDPVREPRDVIVAKRDGDVVALVRILDRAVHLGTSVLKVGGITSVAVRPDCQGQGLGRAVMEAALARSRERGDVLSIAFARRAVDGFYWRLGYVGLGCHPRIVVQRPATGGRVHPLTVVKGLDPAHLPAVREAYERTYKMLPLAFHRDSAQWSAIADRLSWTPAADWTLVADGRSIVGYYIENAGVVSEAAFVQPSGAVRDALLEHAGAGTELTLALHPAHPVAALFRGSNHTATIRHAWDGGHVVRVLDAASFAAPLHGAGHDVRDRWRNLDMASHGDARTVGMEAAGMAAGSLPLVYPPPAWSRADEF
jgi:predicted N-acetyltransferase YhbS